MTLKLDTPHTESCLTSDTIGVLDVLDYQFTNLSRNQYYLFYTTIVRVVSYVNPIRIYVW